ncbi:sensor histidine kinase [Paenibacillus radicis (ex Gao et al. 2016)]|uniref:histidine kinase n=1 Tax=Paenibacillus radicis (ex Gao et al. 2016) TaxID=1737354 RepID=A0A917LS25_9BACL|nr:HAMP domain-containing sensor histidine kinase [Paenibacillus radicis (ex Gao et al. 2016)]GGG53187.1 two-component sensor histidine kinase [Paenibacillus radicis (ex Gao et al. 2016)]
MLLILTILSMTAAALLLVRLIMLRRELGRMTEQLRSYNEGRTGKKIDVALFDRKLEALAGQVNRQSHIIVEAEARRQRIEYEFRQAAANISHDIRTPLTSILGYIQLLEAESITPEEKLEYVATVKNRTKRLQALLNDYFELSVIESLDYPLKAEKLGLTGLISDIVVEYYDSFNARGITPEIMLPEENVAVYTDESAVRRVVENLLINTVKYTSGQVLIRLDRQRETADLTIINEAKDLAGSDVSLLFDRFYTADRARSAQTSGLGLSIAKSLMNNMGGTLTAELQGETLIIVCRWKLAATTISKTSAVCN